MRGSIRVTQLTRSAGEVVGGRPGGKRVCRPGRDGRARAPRSQNVAVRLAWLEPEDYPRLLRAADVGLSLHQSSSGLDLPMKASDMLGSGLPVLSREYACVGELIRCGENGMLFGDAVSLSERLGEVLRGLHGGGGALARLREGAARWAAGAGTWDEEWRRCALPVVAPCGAKWR